jgi:hypothetical protein
MITHIINWVKAWIGIKEEQMDPHEELYTKEAESDVPVYENEQAVKAEHCDGHLRFKKSCPACQEIVK